MNINENIDSVWDTRIYLADHNIRDMSVTDVLMTRAATNGYSHPRPRDPGMSTRSREGRGRGGGNGKDSRNVGWLLSGGAGGKPSVRNI